MKAVNKTKPESNKNALSLAGEFAVLSQLALKGFDANMTLGHTKGVDILVSDPIKNRMFKIEVKTSANKPANSILFGHTLNWIMSEKHETLSDVDLFYCFVNIDKTTDRFRFFNVPSSIVADYVKLEHEYWLNQSPHLLEERAEITMRQFRIGLDNDGYAIKTPLTTQYEFNWDFEV
jgi:hypothetical protein